MDAVVAADRPRVSVYMGVSLDLQIAAPDGSLDFLSPYQAAGVDYGYGAFMDTVDTVVMGRHTYDTLIGYDVAWPFGERPVVVCTSRTLPVTVPTVETYSGPLRPLLVLLSRRGLRHVYVDGGALVRQALGEGVVDAITLSVVPELLGSGRSLFASGLPRTSWTLIGSESWPSGLVQLRYERR